MVTFELAIGVLITALLAVMMFWALSLFATYASCSDTAALVARQSARGDQTRADSAVKSAPVGAKVEVDESDREIRVTCAVEKRFGRIGPIKIAASAVMPKEPG